MEFNQKCVRLTSHQQSPIGKSTLHDRDGTRFQEPLRIDLKGKRIAWAGDFKGYLPFEPGVLDVCKAALKTFESMGCIVEEAQPNYPIDAVWRAWLQLRAWQAGGPSARRL